MYTHLQNGKVVEWKEDVSHKMIRYINHSHQLYPSEKPDKNSLKRRRDRQSALEQNYKQQENMHLQTCPALSFSHCVSEAGELHQAANGLKWTLIISRAIPRKMQTSLLACKMCMRACICILCVCVCVCVCVHEGRKLIKWNAFHINVIYYCCVAKTWYCRPSAEGMNLFQFQLMTHAPGRRMCCFPLCWQPVFSCSASKDCGFEAVCSVLL